MALVVCSYAGAQPLRDHRAQLERLQASPADIEDEIVLRRTLYGLTRIEDISPEQSERMVEAARRRVERVSERRAEIGALVEQGIYARNELLPFDEEIGYRREVLDLALTRSRLLEELAAMARAEHAEDLSQAAGEKPVRERFDGAGVFTQAMWKQVSSAFERQFAHALPVSANGETAVHRALGFDHRGRVDVALNPDAAEGLWLRQLLEAERIPYNAFRAAVTGKATGAHIHIGPPSLRLRLAD